MPIARQLLVRKQPRQRKAQQYDQDKNKLIRSPQEQIR